MSIKEANIIIDEYGLTANEKVWCLMSAIQSLLLDVNSNNGERCANPAGLKNNELEPSSIVVTAPANEAARASLTTLRN